MFACDAFRHKEATTSMNFYCAKLFLYCTVLQAFTETHKPNAHLFDEEIWYCARFASVFQGCECKCYICLHVIYRQHFVCCADKDLT